MKITMLYFDTIGKIIKENGYTWEDVNYIQDFKGRVIWCGHEYTLEETFYSTHMGGFDKNKEHEKVLIKYFLKALEEAKKIISKEKMIKILKQHSISFKIENDRILADSMIAGKEIFDETIDITDYTKNQLYTWLGY